MEKQTRGDRILCGKMEAGAMAVLARDMEAHGEDKALEGFALVFSLPSVWDLIRKSEA